MSVSVARSDGATVLTMTSDPSSGCPPLCQLLGALCYSPTLCPRSWRVVVSRRGSQAVLGALWIVNGLMHVGLGAILLSAGETASYQLTDTYCPVWLGVLFMACGVFSLLTERYSSPCFVLLSGIFNLFGAAMSITAIVWYSTQFTNSSLYSMCRDIDYDYWSPDATPTLSPPETVLLERCLGVRRLLQALTYGISGLLVALSVLGLCLGISSAALSFKTLKPAPHGSKPLLERDGTAAGEDEQKSSSVLTV